MSVLRAEGLRGCVLLLVALLVLSARSSAAQGADDDEGKEFELVTCGSAVKLQHVQTRFRLHSHDIKWGSGSGQQSVTAITHMDDPNSLWVVKGPHGSHCPQGTPVKNGQKIRFQHSQTKRNLHSHHFQSPLTKQQEVSCFGEGGNGDASDDWIIETKEGDMLKRGKRFRIKHAATGKYLHTHSSKFDQSNCGAQCPIAGQQEVTGYPAADDENNWWKTAEGIFFPVVEAQG